MPAVKPVLPILQTSHSATRGLQGAWLFYEGAGPTVWDFGPAQRRGTAAALGWYGGPHGWAGSFDGSTSLVSLPTTTALGGGFAQLTVAAWVYATSNTSRTIIMAGNAASSSQARFILRAGAASTVQFALSIGGTQYSRASAGVLSTGAWHHLVGTYDGAALRLYIDGKPEANTTSVSGPIQTGAGSNLLGGRGTSEYWSGLIDSVLVYDRGLSDAEVRFLYHDTFAMFRQRTFEPWMKGNRGDVFGRSGGILSSHVLLSEVAA